MPTVGPLAEFDFQARNTADPVCSRHIYTERFELMTYTDQANGGFTTLALTAPTFANNSAIPNGQYRVLVRALKITGSPTKEEDFETFLSPIIGVTV